MLKGHEDTLQIVQDLSRIQYALLNESLEHIPTPNLETHCLALEIKNSKPTAVPVVSSTENSIDKMYALREFSAAQGITLVGAVKKACHKYFKLCVFVGIIILGVVFVRFILKFGWFYGNNSLYTTCHWKQQYTCS